MEKLVKTLDIETPKTDEDFFRDWESEAFGYGYGTGEPVLMPLLRKFLALCCEGIYGTSYNYLTLEKELGPQAAWLMINVLGHQDVFTYGTSPRNAWLTDHGVRLKKFMLSKTDDELMEILYPENDEELRISCSKGACNCGKKGYVKGQLCPNPFWRDRVRDHHFDN